MPRTRTHTGDRRTPWWRSAVIYEVYIRSFADGDGDGVGDLSGLRARLPHLSDLGVDAVWITPWYPSPQADHGYDVSDYRDIDPRLGTLAEAEELIEEAHRLGLRVIPDIVPNHTSDLHPWFAEALAASPGEPPRARYHFRPGRGPEGELPPNNWASCFGGPAWTRVTEPDGRPGEWYLHLFTPGQPDLNWRHPDVHAEFESILRFWFDRGVDGFRVDVAHGLVKDPGLRDLPGRYFTAPEPRDILGHPHFDLDEVHSIYETWRRVANDYHGERMFVAEASAATPQRLARYVRRKGLHTAFNFDYLMTDWNEAALRDVIDRTTTTFAAVGAPTTWVLSNHDVPRHVTRFGRHSPGATADLQLGTRRARAAALLTLALPGGAYLYQGEELGLEEVEDLPEHALRDPIWERSGRAIRGRDGCRVPIPWSGTAPPFGFGPEGSTPWLPQPALWKDRTAQAQRGDPTSMLELYRTALRLRRDDPALGDEEPLTWLDSPRGVLAFARDPGFTCVVNLSPEPQPLPPHRELLLASQPLNEGRLAPDSAAWLAR